MPKNILIATGIFPPDIGGPALYSRRLAEEFFKMGYLVTVITYGANFAESENNRIVGVSRHWPYGLRQLIYFFKVFYYGLTTEKIFAFDSLGAGLPAVMAGKILGKKVIVRLGGDFLWEKFIEGGKELVTLQDFYVKDLYNNFGWQKRLIEFTLKNSYRVAFTTNFQKDLFVQYYGLLEDKTIVLSNIFYKEIGTKSDSYKETEAPKIILWAGRFIKLKNLYFLIRIFKRMLQSDKNLVLKLIGEGPELNKLKAENERLKVGDKILFVEPLNQDAMDEEIKKSYFCILPSLSEVSPNFALRCLALNQPILLTNETGIKEDFPGLLYADPQNDDLFLDAATKLLDKNFYSSYRKKISEIKYNKSWPDLAKEYLAIK